ncbi:hypothetical protein [Robertmurraya andreesenii]|uniref:Signal transduction histidine kinase n=1 Tax=Anoxybacillus andreesenii TaxID=1325932 RepID=A0ABT9V445_9BACL|nr:hypothetical protein [Robertmurraya andreesenii]MDQ0155705.1 signal transduction histidine kinase [Robertmurraya andreesenii]
MKESTNNATLQNQDLLDQTIAENKQLMEVIKHKNLVIENLLETYEEIRRYLSEKNLDSLEQLLYSLLLLIRALEGEPISNSTKDYMKTLKSTANEQLKQLRQTSTFLFPTCLADLGPAGSIRAFYSNLSKENIIRVKIAFQGQLQRFPDRIEIQLFRVLQRIIRTLDELTIPQATIIFERDRLKIQLDQESMTILKQSSELIYVHHLVDSMQGMTFSTFDENELLIQLG